MLIGVGLIVGGIVVATALFFANPGQIFLMFIGIGLVVIGCIVVAVASHTKKKFVNSFIGSIFTSVMGQAFPDYKSTPNLGMPLEDILYPGFFSAPDKWECSNLTTATYNDIPFVYSDYDLMRRQAHRDSKGNTYYTYDTYAKGRMYRFRFTKNFRAIVKVLEKKGNISFGEGRLEKVETEYIAFNKTFRVYTNDKLVVFYILTPQIQEKVMEFEESLKGQFYMAFINNELFVAINHGNESIYDFKFSRSVDLTAIRKIVSAILLPATFIDELKLDERKFSSDSLKL